MLDLKYIREESERVREALKDRKSDADLDRLLKLDEERRSTLADMESLRHERKKISQAVGQLKKEGNNAEKEMKIASEINEKLSRCEDKNRIMDEELNSLLLTFPNIPHHTVPRGKDESDNRIDRDWGEKPALQFEPEPHEIIGERLGIIDFARASKITGSRFVTMVGDGARLERALINFMLDVQTIENGYTEILPPFIVNSRSLTGTGQLPKFGEDLFKLNERDYYLVPTAEVPLTNHFSDEILKEEDLPVKITAYTPCFRSEAGSYGQDVKGLIRLHQFSKVEIVRISHPDASWDDLESLTLDAEQILRKLGLHYRVVTLCTGDIGFASAKTYDIEVWLPGQNRYREISSCSNFTDFQARRASIRFKESSTGRNRHVHTLNGSALAVGRTIVAILENYQNEDGTVTIPTVLQPYMNNREKIG